MFKKGQIWVSAVLYIALGMIVITLILSAGVPLINKMRDRNTIAQTKVVMFDIHKNIQYVANEAKGSTRYFSPVDITSGKMLIDQGDSNKIEWGMLTTNKMMELDTEFTEGDLKLKLEKTAREDEYEMKLYLDYRSKKVDIVRRGEYENPFKGRYSFSIKNEGSKDVCCDEEGIVDSSCEASTPGIGETCEQFCDGKNKKCNRDVLVVTITVTG